MLTFKALTVLLTSLALGVTAHPGELDHTAEALERREALNMMGKRSLSHCHNQLAARGVHVRNEARRSAFRRHLTRGLVRRDLASAIATDHLSNLTGVTTASDSSTFFTGESQCILAPEVTQGPYYVTGEYFRKDITESQEGVALYLDVQVIDTTTCEPLSGVAMDMWHCNATGVYSGVVASGNGDVNDATNINNTFLRGIQETDSDGVVQFHSIVPGHYSGRTTHAHVLAHTAGNWELLANNTITGGTTSSHVGQLFFDQSLLTEVAAVSPYSTNTQSTTTNSEDSIMSEEAADIDPIVEYVLLGDTVADGIFAWITVGIDSTANYTVSPAATYGENGGVANADSNMGGGGGGAPSGSMGNGTAPSGFGGGNGTAPTGSMDGGNGTAPTGSTVPTDVAVSSTAAAETTAAESTVSSSGADSSSCKRKRSFRRSTL